ncbi:hypothetical protein HZS_3882 [Henneguya salminicola]|nr:hypothetical protein HZS_3882 [Henneguya salminicola]
MGTHAHTSFNMADEEVLELLFPLPPQHYYKNYKNENMKENTAPLPPPIIDRKYQCFGVPCDTNDTLIKPLETQGIQNLRSHANGSLQLYHD